MELFAVNNASIKRQFTEIFERRENQIKNGFNRTENQPNSIISGLMRFTWSTRIDCCYYALYPDCLCACNKLISGIHIDTASMCHLDQKFTVEQSAKFDDRHHRQTNIR